MLTIELERLLLAPGSRVLDLGCGEGRHSRATRLLPQVAAVALDIGPREVAQTAESLRAMDSDTPPIVGAAADAGPWLAVRGDSFRLPFADRSFDCVIAAEILEHLSEDDRALAEVRRVLKPSGILAVSVPRFGPEVLCWALSRQYRNTPGGHLRIYRRRQLRRKLAGHGFRIFAHHFAHALHAPFWWLKCLVGLERNDGWVARYHRLLVWDMFERPSITHGLERLLNPLIGKSEVFYARVEERR